MLRDKLAGGPFCLIPWFLCLAASVPCLGAENDRRWTVYLAQDKHLDYNWCGSTTEIELRMATLLDYYLDLAERGRACWNLDGTIWEEVYRRHRGQAGGARLQKAIREGRIGYAGNHAVLLWGILDTETAIRACLGAASVERSTGVRTRTALVMENPAIPWGVANILTECGFDFLGRGVYQPAGGKLPGPARALPLVWWQAPNGKRILMRWDLYADTGSWGGYAEGYRLSSMAGEKWDAFWHAVLPRSQQPGGFHEAKGVHPADRRPLRSLRPELPDIEHSAAWHRLGQLDADRRPLGIHSEIQRRVRRDRPARGRAVRGFLRRCRAGNPGKESDCPGRAGLVRDLLGGVGGSSGRTDGPVPRGRAAAATGGSRGDPQGHGRDTGTRRIAI